MTPHEDRNLPWVPPDDGDWEYRRFTIGHAVAEMGIARAVQLDDAHLMVYANGLVDLDLELVVVACRHLGKQKRREGETALPSIGDIRDRCHQIRADEKRAEEQRAFDEAYHRANDPMPQARRDALNSWLKDAIRAVQHGHRAAPPPFKLQDSTDVTYKCADCHDTGWVRECHCGERGCRRCHYQRTLRCPCRPVPVAAPPDPEPRRKRRGGGWSKPSES